MMKKIIFAMCLIAMLNAASAEETVSEKAQVGMNSVGRGTKKMVDNTKDALCGKLTGDSKLSCLAKKTKHKVQQGVDTVKDKESEIKNDLDSK